MPIDRRGRRSVAGGEGRGGEETAIKSSCTSAPAVEFECVCVCN
uniref:Uncharacterized protein n=1 Tax=Arundo donax TaxID=35708 RepID=A0A0A9GKJ2_ARUDO